MRILGNSFTRTIQSETRPETVIEQTLGDRSGLSRLVSGCHKVEPTEAALQQNIHSLNVRLRMAERENEKLTDRIRKLERAQKRNEDRRVNAEIEAERIKIRVRDRDSALRDAERAREAEKSLRIEIAKLNEKIEAQDKTIVTQADNLRASWDMRRFDEQQEAELEAEVQKLEREIVECSRTVLNARRETRHAQNELKSARREIERLRAEVDVSNTSSALRREIARLKAELANARKHPRASAAETCAFTLRFNGKETDFARVLKAVFAKMFHSDAGSGSEGEKKLRTEIFKLFWSEIQTATKHAR